MKNLLAFSAVLLMINASIAQTSKTAFCTKLDSVLNFFTWGKPELKGQQTDSDDYSVFYNSRVKLSKSGRAHICVSKIETYFKTFNEWIGEKLTQEKANALYADYFAQLKKCLGEEFKEMPPYSPGEKWAAYYSKSYELELKLIKELDATTYMVVISVTPPEEY